MEVDCSLSLNQTNFTSYNKPISTSFPNWQPIVNILDAIAGNSHQEACPLTFMPQYYNLSSSGFVDASSSNIIRIQNNKFEVDLSVYISNYEYRLYIRNNVSGYWYTTNSNKFISTYCTLPTLNNKAQIETNVTKYIPLVADPNPEEVVTVSFTLNSNNQSCPTILVLYNSMSSVYNQSAQQFATLDLPNNKLQTNINIRQSGNFKIGF